MSRATSTRSEAAVQSQFTAWLPYRGFASEKGNAIKTVLALAVAVAAAPLSATAAGSLPGVADEETTITSSIQDFRRGHGDVLFVRDRTDRWYRLQLNDGCLKQPLHARHIDFENRGFASGVDRFTTVRIRGTSGSWGRLCGIDSIRRSVAPPQVDSDSPITLD